MRPTTLAGRYCGPPPAAGPRLASPVKVVAASRPVRKRPDGPRKDWYLRGATAHPALVAAAAEAGVTILAGTDSSPHGRVADEIRALAAAGLRAHDALAAGSWSARAYLGLGGLIPGVPADAVVYDADPRLDLDRLNAPALSSSAAVSCPAVGRADRPSVPVRQLWPGMYQGHWPWLRVGRDAQGPSRKFLPAG